jgi:UDP-glucuronate 4-epimerase
LDGTPIDVYNHGQMRRDFTFVDDVVDAALAVAAEPPVARDGQAAHRVLNVGHNGPVPLMAFIACLERACGREAIKRFLPMQAGDVPDTWADTSRLEREFGVHADTDLQTGVQRFVDWFTAYYGVSPGQQRGTCATSPMSPTAQTDLAPSGVPG